MGWRKTHTISVKVGKYTTHDGQEKNRYENIGRVMTDDSGGKMYFLNRTFNPAGVPMNRDGDDAVLLSIFEDRPKDSPSGHVSEADFEERSVSVPTQPPKPATVATGQTEQIPIF